MKPGTSSWRRSVRTHPCLRSTGQWALSAPWGSRSLHRKWSAPSRLVSTRRTTSWRKWNVESVRPAAPLNATLLRLFVCSIISALQAASRLSQQAELGGILEEIEVILPASTRWCHIAAVESVWEVFVFSLSGSDGSPGRPGRRVPAVWGGAGGHRPFCGSGVQPVGPRGYGAASQGGRSSRIVSVFPLIPLKVGLS